MSFAKVFNLGIIGCGQMGTAILKGILEGETQSRKNSQPDWSIRDISISVSSSSSVTRLENEFAPYGSRVAIHQSANLTTARNSDVVILGCKPAVMHSILGEDGMREALDGKILVSILAGMDTASTQEAITASGDLVNTGERAKGNVRVVRTMPNIAAREGASMTVVAAPAQETDREAVQIARWLFDHVGKTHEIPESQFDLIGSLVGCSGALFTVAVDGLLDQAVAGGLKRSDALGMITQSLLGLAKLLEAGNHPSVLREEISSPGGATIQGLIELERQGVRSAFSSALGVAGERATALGRK
ncbi:hypothetical protein N7462_008966 [Penicillium macrosclerotiorum]|uniref:uncharacterized protein n=1 Tax=Penicillium macrosclerotiorum TaxID=303699 RepID=UPI0025477345|nr:uncharacterized protein N7462_008966 [Penicillium macrosclerotiorum]KAJ5676069.1 hypothetical protein N7462_008966 [Penicillium macrosclerotiorum]